MTLNPAFLQKGDENYELFWSHVLKAERVQYDYRDHDGVLFSCVTNDLSEARVQRDEWLEKRKAVIPHETMGRTRQNEKA